MADLLINYKYLSNEHLSGFQKYKYKSVDTSPLSNYVMHPFWDRLVKVFPLWMPANLLTFVGWLLSLLVFVVLSYLDPDYVSANGGNAGKEATPSWIWLMCSICTFWAHQLDGCDGKQARRTNSNSPLGELFDHGLDSSAVWLMAMSQLSVFGIHSSTVSPWEFIIIIYVTLFAFYIAHWEKYTTSVLFLPWAYDISQIWLTSAYLLTFLNGVDMWKVTFLDGNLNLPIAFKVTLFIMIAFVCVPFSLYNQYKARRDYSIEHPGKVFPVSIWEGLQPLVSLGCVSALHLLYGYLSQQKIAETQVKLYLVCYGLLYANVNCRLIVAQMSGARCERFNWLAYPLIPMIAISWFQLADDQTMLLYYMVFLSLAHLHYGVNIVRQLSKYLNVYCFKVGKPPKNGDESQTNGCCGHTE